ncbi:MAG: hypothetical protein WEF50_10940 [Myxococcota bacterium]
MIISVEGAELHYTTQGRGTPCRVPTAIGTEPFRDPDGNVLTLINRAAQA